MRSPLHVPSRYRLFLLAIAWIAACPFASNLAAQEDSSESPAKATTVSDPEIPVEHLELLIKPLTKEELVVEADAWRDLLKNTVREIARVRIGVQTLEVKQDTAQKVAEKAEEVKESAIAENGETEAPETDTSEPKETPAPEEDATQNETSQSEQATETEDASSVAATETQAAKVESVAIKKAEEAQSQQENMAEKLAELTQEKADIVQRLEVVLDDYALKGGDVESYKQYIAALSGVAVEVTDASSLWTVIVSWMKSEQGGQRWAWNLCRFLLTLLAFYFGASIVSNFVRRAASRVRGTSQLLVDFLGTFVKQVLMVVGVIVAMAALEIDITPLLAAVGAAGFVVGFALQGTLSNFASGLLILAYRPFDVGDVIEAAGVSGVVASVSLFSTQVRTFDNKLMIVPNNDIWGGTITNATASDTRRVDMVFGIGYDDDIRQAKDLLEKIVQSHDKILETPAPVIKLHELADSSVNFVCRPWTKTEDYWGVYWDLTQTVKEEFDRAGISIPYPQRDVHVYQESGQSETT
ncbi:MAG: mechanosensitive ion channel domain-containing protein [Rubripirellula sp.]